MKDWKRKVAKDVEGITGTGRKYERVYFVTNESARAQGRMRILSPSCIVRRSPILPGTSRSPS